MLLKAVRGKQSLAAVSGTRPKDLSSNLATSMSEAHTIETSGRNFLHYNKQEYPIASQYSRLENSNLQHFSNLVSNRRKATTKLKRHERLQDPFSTAAANSAGNLNGLRQMLSLQACRSVDRKDIVEAFSRLIAVVTDSLASAFEIRSTVVGLSVEGCEEIKELACALFTPAHRKFGFVDIYREYGKLCEVNGRISSCSIPFGNMHMLNVVLCTFSIRVLPGCACCAAFAGSHG